MVAQGMGRVGEKPIGALVYREGKRKSSTVTHSGDREKNELGKFFQSQWLLVSTEMLVVRQ